MAKVMCLILALGLFTTVTGQGKVVGIVAIDYGCPYATFKLSTKDDEGLSLYGFPAQRKKVV